MGSQDAGGAPPHHYAHVRLRAEVRRQCLAPAGRLSPNVKARISIPQGACSVHVVLMALRGHEGQGDAACMLVKS